MTKLGLSLQTDTLFAKKGEAVPTGIAVRSPVTATRVAPPSGLSFLIHRQTSTRFNQKRPDFVSKGELLCADDTIDALASDARAEDNTCSQVVPFAELSPSMIETTRDNPKIGSVWRRLSFRVDADNHRRLKNISDLWGVSLQSLLQRAVDGFLENALTSDDGEDWRH